MSVATISLNRLLSCLLYFDVPGVYTQYTSATLFNGVESEHKLFAAVFKDAV